MANEIALYNFRTGKTEMAPIGMGAELYDHIPQDPIAQNTYHLERHDGATPIDAALEVLRRCAGRQPDGVGELGEWVNQEWMSIPLKPGTVAGVVCQHCGVFAAVEQTIDASPIDIIYQPETVYRADIADGPPDPGWGEEV